jgi:hypothetical protein
VAQTQSESMRQAVDKMYKDLYLGEGKDNPSIVTRMALIEEQQIRISANLTWLMRAVAGEVILVAGEIVLRLLKLL